MADAPKRTLYSVKNTQVGPRGIWSDGVLTYIDPVDDNGGGAVLAMLTDDDKALADATGYFEIAAATAGDKKAAAAITGDAPTS